MANNTRLKKNKKLLNKRHTKAKVSKEIDKGLTILNKIDNKIVSFLGSHITKKSNPEYKHCKKVAYELGKKGYGVITGGGPGVMEAAT